MTSEQVLSGGEKKQGVPVKNPLKEMYTNNYLKERKEHVQWITTKICTIFVNYLSGYQRTQYCNFAWT